MYCLDQHCTTSRNPFFSNFDYGESIYDKAYNNYFQKKIE